MTALLTDNLPLLAGAPNGIKKLRELILELAVRGKLVAQDPNDEPANELLKRIAEEKARLVVEGKIKKQKPLSEREAEDPAFKLPAGWAWARLSDVVNVLNGRAYKKEELLDAGTPVLRVGNLFTSNHWYYSTLSLEEDKYCNPGDLLFAWSASFGPFIWHGERSIYHYHIWKLDFYAKGQLSKHYLYNYLLEQTQEIKAAGHGVSMVHMTKEKMEKLVVPVPPLAEQHRIVAKVDELMALCDRLEAQQADAKSAHTQLVQALLDSLTQASDATEFAANWQRLAAHFHTLFTTEPSIDALKKTLLQLAVMGKLVPQDPSDEPASELMKQIAEEKARLVADGSTKKQKQLPGVTQEETPSAVPAGWCWVRMGEVGETNIGLTYSPSDVGDIGIPVLRSSNVQKGQIDLSDLVRVDMPVKDSVLVQEGDLLICARNGSKALVGKTAMISNLTEPMAFGAFMAIFRSKLNPYLLRFINSPLFRKVIDDVNTTTINQITQNNLRTTLLPLPPLAEQHRIVAKVDQLMALCDQLKTRLTQARQLNEQLACTLVERALAEDSQPVPVATDRKVARALLAAEIVYQLHGEKRMGRVKLQKALSMAEHIAWLEEIQSEEYRYAAGPHDPVLMQEAIDGLQAQQWFAEQALEDGKRYAYRPLAQVGTHLPTYEALWSAEQRQRIGALITLMRSWDTARCERVSTLYSAWNDLLIEGRDASDTAILHEVMYNWNDSKLNYSEAQWQSELVEMKKYDLLAPTGFGKRTKGGVRSLPGI